MALLSHGEAERLGIWNSDSQYLSEIVYNGGRRGVHQFTEEKPERVSKEYRNSVTKRW
jgi:hypothetical protein